MPSIKDHYRKSYCSICSTDSAFITSNVSRSSHSVRIVTNEVYHLVHRIREESFEEGHDNLEPCIGTTKPTDVAKVHVLNRDFRAWVGKFGLIKTFNEIMIGPHIVNILVYTSFPA